MAGDLLSDQTYADLLDAFAAPTATPGGISAAGLAAAMAAALVERCGAAAAPSARTRAGELRRELVDLAERDVSVLAALARAAPADRPAAAAGASGPAAALRDAANEVASLARTLERDGAPRLRGEARCAALLAAAAADTASAVIAANEALARGD